MKKSNGILNEIQLLGKLARLRMTVFSAVTYSVAFTLGLPTKKNNFVFGYQDFIYGWIFILLCQMSAHLLGEYFDFEADSINKHSSPLTGGSKVLVKTNYSKTKCLILGCFSSLLSVLTLQFLPERVQFIGYLIIFFSTQYSGIPFKFNHRALGELTAALVMNILLPLFSISLSNQNVSYFDIHLFLLIIPSSIIKFALFIVLNMADRRSDWLANKITIPVLFGDEFSSKLHAISMFLAYFSTIFLYLIYSSIVLSFINSLLPTTILILLSSYDGYFISKSLLFNRPYSITSIVARSLKHAPLPLIAIFVDCFIKELIYSDSLFHLFQPSFQLRCLPIYPYLYSIISSALSPPPSPSISSSTVKNNSDNDTIIIVGGGISGITLAICLHQLGIPFILLEKRDENAKDDGADLGLWPSSIKILKQIGIYSDFWNEYSYSVKKVHMTKLNEKEEVMNVVNMEKVVEGTGENFRLVGRKQLMSEINKIIQDNCKIKNKIKYNTKVNEIKILEDGVMVRITDKDDKISEINGRIVVGADGINSICRTILNSNNKLDNEIRYNGEVCYRGVCHLSNQTDEIKKLFFENEVKKPQTMSIYYGNGMRGSWGLINDKGDIGFWWLKVKSDCNTSIITDKWPFPFKELYEITQKSELYIHPISDRVPINKWCSERIVLVGDAAHPVTPNMGQGANMAIEDSFILSILLAESYLTHKDGHIESFYNYYKMRFTHTTKIANESYQQSKIGQWSNFILVKLRELILTKTPSFILQNKLKQINIFPINNWIYKYASLSKYK